MSFASLSLLMVLGIVAMRASLSAYYRYHELKNQKSAWVHRERLAGLAKALEEDESVPRKIAFLVDRIAELSFDEGFFSEIKALHAESQKKQGGRSQKSNYSTMLDRKYGVYSAYVREAVEELSWVITYSDVSLARRLTMLKRKNEKPLYGRDVFEKLYSHSHA